MPPNGGPIFYSVHHWNPKKPKIQRAFPHVFVGIDLTEMSQAMTDFMKQFEGELGTAEADEAFNRVANDAAARSIHPRPPKTK
jgi:hypothetical protein